MRALTRDHVSRVASRARALGEPTRVRILAVLARGGQPVGQIAAAVASQQSTVSKHLQVLFNAGLVERQRSASTVIYSIASPRILECVELLARRTLPGDVRR